MLRTATALVLGVLLGFGLAAYDAVAAKLSLCGPFAAVNKRLEDAGETAMFRLTYHNPGDEPQERIIFGNPQTHTYTVVVMGKSVQGENGYACTMYNGVGFYAMQ